MIVTYRDFVAAAGSINSIGFVTKTRNTDIKIVGNHRYLTSRNVVPAANTDNREVRQALLDAIRLELNGKVDTNKGNAFLKSVARQLGKGNAEVLNQPLDRRTIRALVRATEAMLGHKVATDKMTAGGKALNAFFTGQTDGTNVPSDLLLGLIDGAKALIDDGKGTCVDHAWVAGTESGESIHLQKNGDFVEVDCGEGAQFKIRTEVLSGLVDKMQLALVRKSDLPEPQLQDILEEVGRPFEGCKDIETFSGNSEHNIKFARKLSETALMTKFGPQGLEENELRNVPAFTMHRLAMLASSLGMTLEELRENIKFVNAERLNSEETLQQLDMYQKAADNKNKVGYATERKVDPLANSTLHKLMTKITSPFALLKKPADIMNGVKAMMADVISDSRTFLVDQHPEPGGRLRATLQRHTMALANLLCSKFIRMALQGEATAFATPLLDAARQLLGDDKAVLDSGSVDAVAKALQDRLAGDEAKALLLPVEEAIDKEAAKLCTKMQYKMNHAFAQVFAPSGKKKAEAERYDELLATVFDNPRFDGDVKDKDALMEKIDAFVDAFAKAGLSNKALGLVLDDVLKDAKSLADANARFEIIEAGFSGVVDVAKTHPEHLVAMANRVPPVDVMKDVGTHIANLVKRLDGTDANADTKIAFLRQIGDFAKKFASVGAMESAVQACFDVIGGRTEFADVSRNVTDFIAGLDALGDLAANLRMDALTKDNQGHVRSTFLPLLGLIATRFAFRDDQGANMQNVQDWLNTKKVQFADLARAAAVLRDHNQIFLCLQSALAHFMSVDQPGFVSDFQVRYEGVVGNALNPRNQVPREESTGGIQNLADFMVANGMDVTDVKPEVKKPDAELADKRLAKSRELLDKLGSGADMDKGYGLFMTKVMKQYVKSMKVSDQRAMLAAGIRFDDGSGSVMKKMGAFLKGAGPIMQKMLQGFASMDVDKDFLAALGDMKSRLPDIPDEVVKANLLDMVRRSRGKITDIVMTKKLGAASVGQAFLCTVTLVEKDPETGESKSRQQEVVVKMLRPEVEQRAENEKKLFIDIAREVPGMERTFASQLAGILDELDLRKEAENTKAGVVYDKGGLDVKSMKLLDVIEPTKYTMVVERAPGTTVDRFVEKVAKEIEKLTEPFYMKAKRPNENDEEVEVRVPNPNAFKGEGEDGKSDHFGMSSAFGKAIVGLSKLYEETLVQQKRLVTLASKWTTQGIYDSGFYHGDLHAGNIMVDDDLKRDANGKLTTVGNGGLTVIDYGNATKLTPKQQENIIKMMTAATTKDTNVFLVNLKELMSEEGRRDFEAHIKTYHDLVHNIFNLGTAADAANRIFAALQQLQLKGVELPGPIFKFSQCSVRLQGTISQMNALLKTIRQATLDFRAAIIPNFGSLGAELNAVDLHGELLQSMFKGGHAQLGDDKCDFVELQKLIDEKLAIIENAEEEEKAAQKNAPKPETSQTKPAPSPSQVLATWCDDVSNIETPPQICNMLMASMRQLGPKHKDVFAKLSKCAEDVKTAFENMENAGSYKQVKELKNAYQDAAHDNVETALAARKRLNGLLGFKEFVSGKKFKVFMADLKKFLDKFSDELTPSLILSNSSACHEFLSKSPQYATFVDYFGKLGTVLDAKGKGASVDEVRNSLLTGEGIDETGINDMITAMKKIEDDYSDVTVVRGGVVYGLDDIVAKIKEERTHVTEAMKEFGKAYQAAQKALLEDLKTEIAPICHKNKKGEVDARMVSKEALKDFGDAVGHEILDHMLSSIKKNGLLLTTESVTKNVTGWNQTMKV